MRFGRQAKAPLTRRSLRRRKNRKPRNAALGAELLEHRQLLTAASFNSVTLAAQEAAQFTAQPVATITDNDVGVTAGDFAATIDWGDNSPTTVGSIAATAQPGVFQVLGAHTYSEENNFSLRVSISQDGGTPIVVQSLANVADVPVVASGDFTIMAVEGTPPPDQLLATFTDPAGAEAVGDYSANVDWGGGVVTAAIVTADPNVPGQFLVTGGNNHVYNSLGVKTAQVIISHESATDVTVNDQVVVSDAPLVARGGFTYTASEGIAAANQTLATFTDPGGALALSHYSATIDWGDGNITPGTVQSSGGNSFSVLGSHAYAEEGSGVVTVVLNHDVSPAVTVTSADSITDPAVNLAAAPAFTVAEGTQISNATLATFTDPGGPESLVDYSAQINWGDGSVGPGDISFNTGTNIFAVDGSHVYLTPGNRTITVTVSHDISPDVTVKDPVTVSDPSVVATGGLSFTAVEGALSSSQKLATFTDPGVIDPLADYGAIINWGDGTTSSPGSISFNSGSQIFTVAGQHLYAEDGSYTITVALSSDVAAGVTATSKATVSDPAVQAIGGADFGVLEYRASATQTLASFTDPGGGEPVSDYVASINWGDGTTSNGQILADATGQTFNVLASHLYTVFGTYSPAVTIHHDSAPDVTVFDTANVGVPPIQISSLPATWREWTVPVELSPLATLSFTDGQMAATIDWGDGGTSAGVITPDLVGSTGTVRGTHLYTQAGNYTITITINDGPQTANWTIPTTVLRELLPIADPTKGTPNEYYVAEEYGDLLRRAVDGQGLRFWSGLLDQGVPRNAVAASLVTSGEYLSNFVIAPAYQKYLGRAADAGGVQYWVGQMQQGLTDAGLVAALASSPEFFNHAGGSNFLYVGALYQNVLGRASDSTGQGFWVNQLNAGASRYGVALGFAESSEDTADMVINDYELLLDRSPSTGELNAAVTALARGTLTDEGLLALIAATDEYFNLSQAE